MIANTNKYDVVACASQSAKSSIAYQLLRTEMCRNRSNRCSFRLGIGLGPEPENGFRCVILFLQDNSARNPKSVQLGLGFRV